MHRLQPCYNVAYSTLLPLCCTVRTWFCLFNLICLSFPSKVCLKNPIVSLCILILRNVPALHLGLLHFMVNHSHFALHVAAVEIQKKQLQQKLELDLHNLFLKIQSKCEKLHQHRCFGLCGFCCHWLQICQV